MRHGSLFTGIGGFDKAAEEVGWQNIFQVEIDPYCQRVLKKHYPNVQRFTDIREFNAKPFRGAIDVLSGGFPCQDISYAKSWTTDGANQENGIHGTRSGLWFEYLRIIDESRPKWVVPENVAALTNQGLDIVLQTLADIGYNAEWAIIPASYVGAPHLRKRVWIVAYPVGIGRHQESIIFSEIFKQKVRQTSQWEPSRTICEANGKKTLPESFGIYDGLPRKLHDAERMKALGNSIVWQVAYEIFKEIEQYELK